MIDGAIAHLECSTAATQDGGDHHILLGQVLRHARFAGDPLVFAQGQYAVRQNYPHLSVAPASEADAPANAAPAAPNFLRLLSVASQRMSSGFQVHRDALALTPAMARILAALHESARGLDGLEHATYLGRLSLEDALSNLSSQGLVVRMPDGQYALTRKAGASVKPWPERVSCKRNCTAWTSADVEAARRVMAVLQER